MSDFSILNELIQNSVQVPVQIDQHQKRFIYLEEKQDNYGITIRGISDETDIFVIAADRFPPPKVFFRDSKGECKRADFIIITSTTKGKFIIIIEMKAGAGDNISIRQQLRGAQCLATYIKQVGKVFWKNQNFLADYQYRFVSLKHLGTNKKSSRSSKTYSLHNSPEKCLCLSPGKFLQLRELIENLKN